MARRSRRNKNKILLPAVVACIITLSLICAVIFVFPDFFSSVDIIPATYKKGESLLSDLIENEEEIRGVYIATVSNINYPSSQGLSNEALCAELDDIVQSCKSVGFNTIVFQVRPASDSFYNSTIYPASAYITGAQGVWCGLDILRELTDRAHAENIAVVAWVNPLRVTSSSTDLSSLAETNPARVHPEHCVEYAGALYLDPAFEEVRKTVARGCAEIASGYDVDAILFDDYFYPYPKDGQEFDDKASFAEYNGEMDLGDWRRENVNKLVKECYDAVKAVDKYCLFGIAPFGIWSNDNGFNGGSATRGLDAYNDIYCDALAWAKGGYIDFLAPQIYWSFDNTAAPYATLADWWADALAETDVTLLTSNAGYRVSEWSDKNELAKQIEYNRQLGYKGALIYGYASIKNDENEVVSCLAGVYTDESAH